MRRHRGCICQFASELISHEEMSYRSSVALISHMKFAALISYDDISPTSTASIHLYFIYAGMGGFILDMNYYMCKTFLPLENSQIAS
jgi:hypothetical protein